MENRFENLQINAGIIRMDRHWRYEITTSPLTGNVFLLEQHVYFSVLETQQQFSISTIL